MEKRFGATVTVERPIEEVFAYLADGENDKEFSPRVLEIAKTTGGPIGVGTVYASTVKDGGVKTKREFELTDFEKPAKIRWREISASAPILVPEGGYDLIPAGPSGTELSFFNVLEPGTSFGKLIIGLAFRSARKGAGGFANSIKQTIESS